MQKPGFALALDLSFSSPPVVTASSIAVPIRAELLNTLHTESVPMPTSLPVSLARVAAYAVQLGRQ